MLVESVHVEKPNVFCVQVPFCRTAGLLGSSGLGSVPKLPESYPRSPRPRRAEPHAMPVPFTREPWPWTLGRADLSATGRASAESTVPAHQVPAAGDPAASEGDSWDEGSSGSPTPHPPGKCCPLTGTCPRPGGALRAWCSSLMGLGSRLSQALPTPPPHPSSPMTTGALCPCFWVGQELFWCLEVRDIPCQ